MAIVATDKAAVEEEKAQKVAVEAELAQQATAAKAQAKQVARSEKKAKRRQKWQALGGQYNTLMEKHVVAVKMVPLLAVTWGVFALVNTVATDSIASYMLGGGAMTLTMFLSRAWPAKNLRVQEQARKQRPSTESEQTALPACNRKGVRLSKSL